jgi:hypothetical protein
MVIRALAMIIVIPVRELADHGAVTKARTRAH